jgi:hypothetical protein
MNSFIVSARPVRHTCVLLAARSTPTNLARAYGKLDITTRAELERVLEPEKARVPTL